MIVDNHFLYLNLEKDIIDIFRYLSNFLLVLRQDNAGTDEKRMFPPLHPDLMNRRKYPVSERIDECFILGIYKC